MQYQYSIETDGISIDANKTYHFSHEYEPMIETIVEPVLDCMFPVNAQRLLIIWPDLNNFISS